MADQRAKAERSKAKDGRQMPAADRRARRAPGKKHKPVSVLYRGLKGTWTSRCSTYSQWSRYGRYRTVQEAEAAIENAHRKYPYFEYMIEVAA